MVKLQAQSEIWFHVRIRAADVNELKTDVKFLVVAKRYLWYELNNLRQIKWKKPGSDKCVSMIILIQSAFPINLIMCGLYYDIPCP